MYSFKIYRTYGCSSFGRCLPRMYKALGLILSSVYKPNMVIQHHYSAPGKLQHEDQMFKLIRCIVSLRLANATWDYVFKKWMKGFIWQHMLIIPTTENNWDGRIPSSCQPKLYRETPFHKTNKWITWNV